MQPCKLVIVAWSLIRFVFFIVLFICLFLQDNFISIGMSWETWTISVGFSSVQSLSRVQLFATPWTAACQASLSITNSWGLPKHAHCVGDSIQPSHPLSSPSPPALNLFQHQGLFKWVSSPHQVAKVLEFQLQHQSLQWTPKTDLL